MIAIKNHAKLTVFALLAGLLTSMVGCAKAPTQHQNSTQESTQDNANHKLLNVSYDVARDFYKDFNPLFVKAYAANNQGKSIEIQQSHGGSSKQALAVANGLQADVVTMNQGSDVELLVNKGLVAANWRSQFPNDAVPYTSTVVFLVRKDNPKGIKDWSDLSKDGVQIVLANPKTTGNGRYAFLGAYGYGLHTFNKDETKTKEFVKALLKNVSVYENGGRSATTTFLQRQIGDVLVTFENEANLAVQNFGQGQVKIIYPSYTVSAGNPVAIVNAVTDKKGTTAKAKQYLDYLWSDSAQQLAADLYLRPSNQEVLAKNSTKLPKLDTFNPRDVFGDWKTIMKVYFQDGGVFDELATPN
ncbi:ABC sulfate/thiosulfate transporter periplasmic solute-binding protein [Moraxella macacae 0408225]|uniref:ABC sulfate/thiosulfate transporter periplasmic solute-binding protein n=1 Tax=Moraxella macacae 0408225 TaxID=1230338 RepID=L2F5W3_9GAMM|nr:sulfate ABC transporter substrate-binding protein [Moraxella macacae]ELA08156.1 ABC sulfate/thiosulfate transporter periplasmic solute-binding protein [Moraxella macacae 0408225]